MARLPTRRNHAKFHAPPTYGAHIAGGRLGDRWAADLISIESKPARRAYTKLLFVQDILSRVAWAEPLKSKAQVRFAFDYIQDKGRKSRGLNSKKGTEVGSCDFQTMLARRANQGREKGAANNIATGDTAMGTLRSMVARMSADEAWSGDCAKNCYRRWLATID